jgi:YD repeat-containing protein
MLGRLKTATNPETGLISYEYDNNGNLIQKTQADNVVSHWEYDALNRPTRLWYTGESGYTTPQVRYCYDGLTYNSTEGTCTGTSVTAQAFSAHRNRLLGLRGHLQLRRDGATHGEFANHVPRRRGTLSVHLRL